MKSFLVCVAVLGLASSALGKKLTIDDPKPEEYDEEFAACAKEVGVKPDFLEKMEKDGFKAFETRESKCFIRCVLTKFEMIKDDEPNMEQIKEDFGADDDVVELVKFCVKENKQEDPCDRVFEMYKCFMTQIDESPK